MKLRSQTTLEKSYRKTKTFSTGLLNDNAAAGYCYSRNGNWKICGLKGIRDHGILESAINRPYHTFDGTALYLSEIEKAAAIFESIVKNHPFIDGNKRTAYILMRVMLLHGGKDISASEDEKYEFVIQSAKGELSFD